MHLIFAAFVSSLLPLMAVSAAATASTSYVYVGQGTYFAPATGACGIVNTDSDQIVAVSHLLYDNYPGATANPNNNPICKRSINITYKGVTAPATITDRCVGCNGTYDLDMTSSLFSKFSSETAGRLDGVEWSFV